MRIIHLSASDFRGPVSRGVLALHHQLMERGMRSRFFARDRMHDGVEPIHGTDAVPLAQLTQRTCFDQNRVSASASGFTLGYPSGGLIDARAVSEADIIHLHDIKGIFSPQVVNWLLCLGKPVVWSLSDMWPFTGGCHFSPECEGYRSDCSNCPQIKTDRHGLPALLLKKRRALFDAPNLHVIAPTAWIAERAASSGVFGRGAIHCGIAPVTMNTLHSLPKNAAKERLGFSPEIFTLLVMCENTGHRKYFRGAVRQLLESCAHFHVFAKLARQNRLRILVVGDAPEECPLDFGAMHVSVAGDEKKMAALLSAADLAVLPHVEETARQGVAEAAAFGTPVIAMNAGGMDECVRDGITGRLVPLHDLRRMAEEISYVALHPRIQGEWEKNCLETAARERGEGVARHLALYREILESRPASSAVFADLRPPELRHELPDLLPVFMELVDSNIASVIEAAHAQAALAQNSADDLKQVIATAIGKLSLAEQRIQMQLRKGVGNAKIEKNVVSIGKLRHHLSRILRERKLKEHEQKQRFEEQVPEVTVPENTRSPRQPNAGERFLQWACDVSFGKGHAAKPGILEQYAPRPLKPEKFPRPRLPLRKLPSIAIVTPSYMQGGFIEQTILSVIDQHYPKLRYVVQDAGSTDETVEILKKHSSRITSWVSEPDTGQARAVACGFEKVSGDIMAWLNSDDLLLPGTLRFVGEYFRRHPKVDAIYGHRIIVNEHGREIGRWVLPPHDPELLRSIDYVPQETLFWRKSLWRKVGGISPNFRFALDWDLLLRFQKAGANIVRVPYYLGCFRVHTLQKTSSQMETIGHEEVTHLRLKTPGALMDPSELTLLSHKVMRQSVFFDWLLRHGIRW